VRRLFGMCKQRTAPFPSPIFSGHTGTYFENADLFNHAEEQNWIFLLLSSSRTDLPTQSIPEAYREPSTTRTAGHTQLVEYQAEISDEEEPLQPVQMDRAFPLLSLFPCTKNSKRDDRPLDILTFLDRIGVIFLPTNTDARRRVSFTRMLRR